jgi:hypothetical protein
MFSAEKKVAFPDERDFRVLFPESSVFDFDNRNTRQSWTVSEIDRNGVKLNIRSFCSVSDARKNAMHRNPMNVQPSQAVLDYLAAALVVSGTISFEVVIRSRKEALIVAQYSEIIGSRWLALVDPKTVPKFPDKKEANDV